MWKTTTDCTESIFTGEIQGFSFNSLITPKTKSMQAEIFFCIFK